MTYEEKIILVNKEQEDLGFDPINAFEYKGEWISNPYMLNGKKVIPEEYYGQAYSDWKKNLKAFEKDCKIFVIDNFFPIVVYRQEDGYYSFVYDNYSFCGSKEDVIEEMKSSGIPEDIIFSVSWFKSEKKKNKECQKKKKNHKI